MSLVEWLGRFPDRCSRGFSLEHQHPSLCNCQHAETRKRRGLAAVDAKATDAQRNRVDAAIRQVAQRGGEFSANDVRLLVSEEDAPIMGSRFTAAAKGGRIIHVGFEKSSKGSTNSHRIMTWKAAS